ncbi:MAG: ion transporter [Nocardioides sp.]
MEERRSTGGQSNAYELFILVLTVYSLVIMVALLLPTLSTPTVQALQVYDNVICVIFLGDFALRMSRAPSKRAYFFKGRGWLEVRRELVALREHLTDPGSADDEP